MTITRESCDLLMKTGAVFSDDGRHRYLLWREWDAAKPRLVFLMLNPSTADELVLDPTIRGCMTRAATWGYGRLDVVNLFGFRSTDPDALLSNRDATAFEALRENQRYIAETCLRADLVVCAWGNHKGIGPHADVTLSMLDDLGVALSALKLNKDGSPQHPLYVPHALRPIPYLRVVKPVDPR